jgi:hypothetical protein
MFERRLGHLVSQNEMLGVEVMVKPEEIERMLEMRASQIDRCRVVKIRISGR